MQDGQRVIFNVNLNFLFSQDEHLSFYISDILHLNRNLHLVYTNFGHLDSWRGVVESVRNSNDNLEFGSQLEVPANAIKIIKGKGLVEDNW